MSIMEFVIELDELACGAAKCKVVCRGWERKRRSQLNSAFHQIQVGQVEAELRPIRNRSNGTSETAHPT